MRSCESDETAEMSAGFDGQNAVLYVQLPMGSVFNECPRVGDHYFVSEETQKGKCQGIQS